MKAQSVFGNTDYWHSFNSTEAAERLAWQKSLRKNHFPPDVTVEHAVTVAGTGSTTLTLNSGSMKVEIHVARGAQPSKRDYYEALRHLAPQSSPLHDWKQAREPVLSNRSPARKWRRQTKGAALTLVN
jgi:hypothetical protein